MFTYILVCTVDARRVMGLTNRHAREAMALVGAVYKEIISIKGWVGVVAQVTCSTNSRESTASPPYKVLVHELVSAVPARKPAHGCHQCTCAWGNCSAHLHVHASVLWL
jgi:hypothetical protein